MNTHRFELGQKVFCDYSLNRKSGERPTLVPRYVIKTGRKWVVLSPNFNGVSLERFDAETLLIDGGTYASPGRVWESEADFEASVRDNKLWRDLRTYFDRHHSRPEGLSEEVMLEVAKLLGVEL